MVWTQVYDPLGNPWLSTLCAAIPIIVLLGGLAFFNIAAHWAAILGLVSALFIAIVVYGMPTATAGVPRLTARCSACCRSDGSC